MWNNFYHLCLLKLNRIFKFVDGGHHLLSIYSPYMTFKEPKWVKNIANLNEIKPTTFKVLRDNKSVVLFKDVIVSMKTGNVYKQIDNKVYYIIESDYRHSYQALWSGRRPTKKPNSVVNEEVVVVPHRSGNYYHFLIEELPDILQEIEQGPKRIIASINLGQFAKDTLDFKFEVEYIYQRELFAKQLIKMPKVLDPDSIMSYKRLKIVKNHFIDVKPRMSIGLKIFIQRDSNDEFEKMVSNIFYRQGYLILDPVKLSIFDQVRFFKSATHIAGIAGAGFANLIFTNSNKSTVTAIQIIDARENCQKNQRSYGGIFWEPFCFALKIKYKLMFFQEEKSFVNSIKKFK